MSSGFRSPASGELNQYLALETLGQAPSGGSGGVDLIDTYTLAASAWGRVLGLLGGRYVAGRQVEEVATHRIVIRYRTGFQAWTHVSRAVVGGTQRYRIHKIHDPEGRGRWLELDVEEQRPS